MRSIAASVFAIVVVTGVAWAQTQQPAPKAPAPGSPATYKAAEELAAVLKAAKPTAGGMTTSAIANTDQYRVNIVHRVESAGAIAHAGNTELHYIISGSGTLITGGTLVRGGDGKPATITDGVSQHVKPGDVVIVPANSPHWYSQMDSAITYLEVRWLAPE